MSSTHLDLCACKLHTMSCRKTVKAFRVLILTGETEQASKRTWHVEFKRIVKN